MNRYTKGTILLILFILTFVSNTISHKIAYGSVINDTVPPGVGLVLQFALVFGIVTLSSWIFGRQLSRETMLWTIFSGFSLYILLNLIGPSIKYHIKILPIYLVWFLGYGAAVIHIKKRSWLSPLVCLFVTLVISFGLADTWKHKIEFGNWTGEVEEAKVVPFEFTDKTGIPISNSDLEGQFVLLDFWFIGCRPCWEKFPDLQALYDRYQMDDRIAIYAVNRSDDPEKVFQRIEERGYTFPVLLGNQDIMDDFGIYVYPTVVLLNRSGEVVFMGELEQATEKLSELLKAIN